MDLWFLSAGRAAEEAEAEAKSVLDVGVDVGWINSFLMSSAITSAVRPDCTDVMKESYREEEHTGRCEEEEENSISGMEAESGSLV